MKVEFQPGLAMAEIFRTAKAESGSKLPHSKALRARYRKSRNEATMLLITKERGFGKLVTRRCSVRREAAAGPLADGHSKSLFAAYEKLRNEATMLLKIKETGLPMGVYSQP